jgi:hypothetical protein
LGIRLTLVINGKELSADADEPFDAENGIDFQNVAVNNPREGRNKHLKCGRHRAVFRRYHITVLLLLSHHVLKAFHFMSKITVSVFR